MKGRALSLIAILTLIPVAMGPIRVTVSASITSQRGALIPVSLLDLEIAALADSTIRSSLKTDWEGKAITKLKRGKYRIRTTPLRIADSTYAWDVTVTVASKPVEVRLTRANATVTANVPSASHDSTGPAPPDEVFERWHRGVFRIESGWRSGSGFLIDESAGIVLTAAEVLDDDQPPSVYLDSVTRVPAFVLAKDEQRQLALLRIPVDQCAACVALRLAPATSSGALVRTGEPLVAIGFAAGGARRMVTASATNVSATSFAAELRLADDDAGGPILNLMGEVVAVSVVRDSARHAKTRFAIASADAIREVLAEAATGRKGMPSSTRLPIVPRRTMPESLIAAFVDTTTFRNVAKTVDLEAGRFVVSFATPSLRPFALSLVDSTLSDLSAEKRADAKEVSAETRVTLAKQFRLWDTYVRSERAAVVALEVVPRVKKTLVKKLTKALRAEADPEPPPSALAFEGSVKVVRFYRNGAEVVPARGGLAPQMIRSRGAWTQAETLERMGYYLFSPEVFAPDPHGTPPHVMIAIADRAHPRSVSALTVPPEVAARIWNEFVPLLKALESRPVVWAKPIRRPRSRRLVCDPETAECKVAR